MTKTFLSLMATLVSIPAFAFAAASSLPPDLAKQVDADLAVFSAMKGSRSSKIHASVYGGTSLDGGRYLAFFNDRVKEMGMDDCGGGAGVVACVIPFQNNTAMWFTPNYVKFNMPQLVRLSILLHEARHTEMKNSFWRHATCPVPFRDEKGNDIRGIFSGALLEGKAACDSTELGSYGIHTVFLKNIELFCESCSEKVRMDGQLYGDDGLRRIINAGALKRLKDDLAN